MTTIIRFLPAAFAQGYGAPRVRAAQTVRGSPRDESVRPGGPDSALIGYQIEPRSTKMRSAEEKNALETKRLPWGEGSQDFFEARVAAEGVPVGEKFELAVAQRAG